ncbi:LuxR C-terminal-related transcriptional regulator [Streptomyces sp. TX20-6-3]|uniref:LuxR C-terminal-related transcriptional regulator n=1 Tax=Streptomyces sp. TX20-6-3 TaxID=3028705 RepID=UPI0029B4516C|nr:LuxR C-terminal-related transcriptional regulator [Streptomyces sp. TX20-6-3]MDX2565264.1 LuxR C-terminal-related transcriptional regulator [Streptomyces sp. TX20-6-3]
MVAGSGGIDHDWVFAGRDDELRGVQVALEDAKRDTVLIYGEAGAGKTRLASELLRWAAAAGAPCEQVRATATAAELPLGALSHLLESDVASRDPVALFQEAVAAFAKRSGAAITGGRTPARTVVFVDDLHHLDATSAMLLGQLLDARVLFVVATVRSGLDRTPVIDSFERGDRTHKITLGQLTENQTQKCLECILGGQVERAAALSIANISGGNWLFLREIVQDAVRQGILMQNGGIWQLSGSLAGTPKLSDLISARLSRTTKRQRSVLEALALCEPLEYEAISSLARAEELHDLELKRLLVTDQASRRISAILPHPLYGEVIRSEVSSLQRHRILTMQVERVRSHGARRRNDALRIATWQMQSGSAADSDILVPAALLARHAHDWNQVVDLLSAAAETQRDASLQQLLAESLHQLGRWEDAELAFSRAHELADGDGQVVAIAMERTQNMLYGFGSAPRALAVNNEAKRKTTSQEMLRVLQVNEAAVLTTSGYPQRGLEMLKDAANLNIPRVRLWGQSMTTLGYALTGQTRLGVDWGFRSYAEHTELDAQEEPTGPSMPASAQVIPLLIAMTEAGQLEKARSVGEKALHDAVKMKALQPQIWIALNLGRCSLIAGHINEAHRYLLEALAVARHYRYPRVLSLASSYLMAAESQSGQSAAPAAPLESDLPQERDYLAGEDRIGHAWLLASRGETRQAIEQLLQGADLARGTGQLASEGWLLTEAARLGACTQTQERLREIAHASDSPLYEARAQWAEAASTEDPRLLLEASRQCAATGLDLLAAEAAAMAAAFYRAGGHARQAVGALVASRSCARRCSHVTTPLLRSNDTPTSLTSREQEIAVRAARGQSSREIADALVLSPRTIDNHLQRIYAKLGVTSRKELTPALELSKTALDGVSE